VVAVGDEAYVAGAKGPLTPGASIVLPVTHAAAASECDAATLAEVRALRAALGACFKADGLETVAFERQMGSASAGREREHMHVQIVPLPKGCDASAVRAGLEAEAARAGLALEWTADGSWPPAGVRPGEGYLWYQLPNEQGALLHRMCAQRLLACATTRRTAPARQLTRSQNPIRRARAVPRAARASTLLACPRSSSAKRHPMMFARQALARALGLAARADWKVCMPDPRAPGSGGKSVAALEAEEVDALKRKFAPFDPCSAAE
jgi:diadenosine tetraphosphate (Ap4A) HIT family hydrolase